MVTSLLSQTLSTRGTSHNVAFWKLNSKILDDRNFQQNFDKILEELISKQEAFNFISDWFDHCFKPEITSFLKDFSSLRQKSRRDTRELLLDYLQRAGRVEDVETMSYVRARLKRMDLEDSQGILLH